MRCVFGLLVLLAVLALVACGGDQCAEPLGDATGVWRMSSTVVDDDCGERQNQTFRMEMVQDGSRLTAVTPELELNGTICGNQIRMSGSYSEDGATVTVNATLDISADGQSVEGSDTWTWTDGVESCSGSDSLNGTRVEPVDVFPCTEQGIRDAITIGGGPHTFACAGPTVVPEYFRIRNDVILDGGGLLTTDGWEIASGVSAELHGFMISNQMVYADGGGVTNGGTLLIRDCMVSGFDARGISNSGTLTLSRSTVTGNGGGISNFGIADVINSTVSGNTILQEGSNWGAGAHNSGRLTIIHSTISDNSDYFREEGPSGLHNSDDATLIITNSIVDGNCDGEITSNGYNIESPGGTCGFDQLTDQVDVSAERLNLGSLADNGGPTLTHALEAGSEAINKIPADACELAEDQRGEPRPEMGGDACDKGAFERQPDEPQRGLDMLIMIDDSASMRDEQAKLREQVPRLVNLLLTGGEDIDGSTPVGEFPAVQSLHVGIIIPDLGYSTVPSTNFTPPDDFTPPATCTAEGKRGFMQVEGFIGEPPVVCSAVTPSEGTLYLNFPVPGFTAADLVSDIECLTGQADGCGFEQQLEAILESDRNAANGGFNREGALLAIIMITDEDDCSTTDPRVFDTVITPGNPFQGPFTTLGELQPNLRCWQHGEALQLVRRYVDEVVKLKPDPSQIVFAAITGIPQDDALDRENFDTDEDRYAAILAHPDMVERPPEGAAGDTQATQLVPACDATDGSGSAAPGRRIVETMQGLAEGSTGVGTVVESICADDYAPAVDAIVDRIAAALHRSGQFL